MQHFCQQEIRPLFDKPVPAQDPAGVRINYENRQLFWMRNSFFLAPLVNKDYNVPYM
jgi:hypothetical protein